MSTYRQDYHVHTGFSVDSEASMEAVCQVAVARGIDEIAFTDHLDFGPLDPAEPFPTRRYVAAVQRCRERYQGRLIVRTGIEIGEPHIFADDATAVVSAGDFDVVLGSVHYGEGMEAVWLAAFFERPLRHACESYFRQTLQLARHGEFDVLGHLDVVKRYAPSFGQVYDGPEPYEGVIRAVLQALVERGKGLELNMSPLRRGQCEPCPSLEILRWYRELGGEVLTVGSDAHSAEMVGSHVELALEMARSAGFRRLASFRHRNIEWKGI